MITLEAQAKREGGQWKINLFTDGWVIDDILRDAELHNLVVITLNRQYGGNTMYSTSDKPPRVLAIVKFEETNVTPKDE